MKRDIFSRTNLAVFFVLFVLVVDQILKIWVKTTMLVGESHFIFGEWFQIRFLENNGMAFGLEFGGEIGKLLLSSFRIVAVGVIIWYMRKLIIEKAPKGLIISISLILAGAVGNIIDSAVFGLIFSESTGYAVASLFPDGGGYASFLHGKVVDMLYFPIIKGHYPYWFPINPTEYFEFFRPIFNLADTSISIGVMMILIFQRKFFKEL